MESGLKYKIAILLCLFCYFKVGLPVPVESNPASNLLTGISENFDENSSSRTDHTKNVAKRNADWSKKIAASDLSHVSEIADGSENVEVSSQGPRIVRKMRIHHGAQKLRHGSNVEEFKEISPEFRSMDGGVRVVRVKKYRRKSNGISSTVEPEIMTTSTATPFTVNPKVTTSSDYVHITVINKEVKNPKRNKNRKKKPRNQWIQTTPYTFGTNQNGIMHVTMLPEIQYSEPRDFSFNSPNPYQNYGSYNMAVQSMDSRNQKIQSLPKADYFQRKPEIPLGHEKHFSFEPATSRISRHLLPASKDAADETGETSSVVTRKFSEHPHFGEKIQEANKTSTNKDTKDNVSQTDKEIYPISDKISINSHSEINGKTEKEVTMQRTGDSTSAIPKIVEDQPILLVVDGEETNKTTLPISNMEPLLYPQIPSNPNTRNINPLQQRYQSQYPSFLHDQQHEQHAFSDPFFASSGLHFPPVHGNRQSHSMMPSLRLPYSPFYSPHDPESEEYIYAHPYQSDDLIVPGFHHSPQLRSLRRTILDTYEDETTTSNPVTPFSLPKFELPSIDFNDKGCQTVYKEVKSVPGDGLKDGKENAKSFVLTRECYFPDGVPTTGRIKDMTTEIPASAETSERKIKDMEDSEMLT